MTRYWIGVAAADHIARGVAGGFMQANHGKATAVTRLKSGDVVAFYSPVKEFGGKEKLQAFTALGVVKDRPPYEGDMGAGFKPFRRDMTWREATPAPIQPLLEKLSFTRGQKSWGYKFRLGFFEIDEADMKLITDVMSVPHLHPR